MEVYKLQENLPRAICEGRKVFKLHYEMKVGYLWVSTCVSIVSFFSTVFNMSYVDCNSPCLFFWGFINTVIRDKVSQSIFLKHFGDCSSQPSIWK